MIEPFENPCEVKIESFPSFSFAWLINEILNLFGNLNFLELLHFVVFKIDLQFREFGVVKVELLDCLLTSQCTVTWIMAINQRFLHRVFIGPNLSTLQLSIRL